VNPEAPGLSFHRIDKSKDKEPASEFLDDLLANG
jgi:hypothetical protein